MIVLAPRLAALRTSLRMSLSSARAPSASSPRLRSSAGASGCWCSRAAARVPSPPPGPGAVAENLRPDNHFEPRTAVARRLGGSSNLWAGRCVPFDPIDFRARPWLASAPGRSTEDDLAPYLAPALDALGGRGRGLRGPPRGDRGPGVPLRHAGALEQRAADRETARPGAGGARRPPGGAARDGDSASAIGRTAASPGWSSHRGRGQGGNPRLPRRARGRRQRQHPPAPARAGARPRALRRRRRPARARLHGPSLRPDRRHRLREPGPPRGLDYHVDAHGSYVRRRLVPAEATQEADRLANVAFWPVVPPIATPRTARGPCPRSSSRSRWRRSGGG